jgi:hypothetical protein
LKEGASIFGGSGRIHCLSKDLRLGLLVSGSLVLHTQSDLSLHHPVGILASFSWSLHLCHSWEGLTGLQGKRGPTSPPEACSTGPAAPAGTVKVWSTPRNCHLSIFLPSASSELTHPGQHCHTCSTGTSALHLNWDVTLPLGRVLCGRSTNHRVGLWGPCSFLPH